MRPIQTFLCGFVALVFCATGCHAQSTNSVIGAITTIGCPGLGTTSCFVQFSSSNPLPVTIVSGGGGGGGSVTQGTTPWVDNISQFGGSNVVTGAGVGGAGIPRVTVSSDSSLSLIGTLPAFASTPAFNESQLNGVTVALGAGASNTGTQRVVLSTDSTVGLSGTLPAFATPPFVISYGNDATGVAPTKAPLYEAGLDTGGLVRPFGLDVRGAFITPIVAAAGTTITKCSIAATSATATCNTYVGTGGGSAATVVCPAATNLQSEEIRTSVGPLAVSLVGNTLTTGTDGTGTGTPDMILPTANTLYTLPLPQSNAITAYNPNASAAITVCIQKARQ